MKKLIALFMLFSMGLLPQESVALDQPSNFQFTNNILTWDDVEFAQTYMVTINGKEYERQVPFVEFIKEGSYQISVVAMGEGFEESMTGEYNLQVDYNQSFEITFNQQEDMILWSSVPQATHYLIGNDFGFIKEDNNHFLIEDDLMTYLTVQAVFPDGSKTDVFIWLIEE